MAYPADQEGSPEIDIESKFEGVEGQGRGVWLRTPSEMGVAEPITAEHFTRSTEFLMNMRLLPDVKERIVVNRQEQFVMRRQTTGAAVIREVYKRTLPDVEQSFIERQVAEAEAEEAAYLADGALVDAGYLLRITQVARHHADTLLIQGVRALRERAEDFHGSDLYGELFVKTERFIGHLILMQDN